MLQLHQVRRDTAVDRLAAATIHNKRGVLTGRTVTPALIVSLLQKAMSSSVLPSDSSDLQCQLSFATGGRTHAQMSG